MVVFEARPEFFLSFFLLLSVSERKPHACSKNLNLPRFAFFALLLFFS